MSVGGRRIGAVGVLAAGLLVLGVASPAVGQFYTFTSGPTGDGFIWDFDFPPAGLNDLPEFEFFETPDGVGFYNDVGNTIFFDSSYQVAGNGSLINGDALWANPTDQGFGVVSLDFSNVGNVQEVSFDFAWSEAGVPAAPDTLVIEAYDSEGRGSIFGQTLTGTFTGFGGGTGYEDTIFLSTGFLVDDFGDIDGGSFVDIDYVDVYVDEITFGSNTAEFAIDNFSVDGSSGGGPDEVFPSFNQGSSNASNVTASSSSLRGTGTFTRGVEVTNGGAGSTTFSVEVEPGGDMTAGPGTVTGANIAAGQSVFNPDIVSLDRSLPTGSYTQDLRIINDGDPTDPDNITTVRSNLYEPQQLSGNFANVNVNNFEDVILGNAAAVPNGFRAAVKVTGSQTTGPFTVQGFNVDDRVLDGDTLQANVVFNRFGQLSGTKNGTFAANLAQAAFSEFSGNEIFLANTEPVPDQVWNLTYTLANATTDFNNFSPGGQFNERVGINTFDVAATLIGGTSSKNQQISLQFMNNPNGGSADLIDNPADLVFSGSVDDIFVLQFTYEPFAVPAGATEGDLSLLWYDPNAAAWTHAVDGNTGGTPTAFDGSYADFLAGPGSGSLDAGDLGYFGLDTVNNHVWAVLNHASLFGVGVLTAAEILGDYNDNGLVEQGDLNQVLNNWGTAFDQVSASWINQRPTDGIVDQAELNVVLNRWGSDTAPDFGGAIVPEPAALGLLALLAAARRQRV